MDQVLLYIHLQKWVLLNDPPPLALNPSYWKEIVLPVSLYTFWWWYNIINVCFHNERAYWSLFYFHNHSPKGPKDVYCMHLICTTPSNKTKSAKQVCVHINTKKKKSAQFTMISSVWSWKKKDKFFSGNKSPLEIRKCNQIALRVWKWKQNR